MRILLVGAIFSAFLTGCGVEMASTAATAAAAKAKEVEEGKKTIAKVRGQLDAAVTRQKK